MAYYQPASGGATITFREAFDHGELLTSIGHTMVEVWHRIVEQPLGAAWVVLVDGMHHIPWEPISALSTAAAALFAALSAWTSRQSATAAQAAVEDARNARREEKAPRLVLEKDFFDFKIVGPHMEAHHGWPFYEAREDHTTGYRPTPATFSLTNHGGGPGLEVQIVFDLEDSNGELLIPAGLETLGLLSFSTGKTEATSDGPTVPTLELTLADGGGCGLPMYRRWTIDLPNCAPGQTRKIELPTALLARLLLRGLQQRARGGSIDALEDIILTIKISCHTSDGELYQTQFRFKLHPFWQGEVFPLKVPSHISEMPMYPKSDKSRVA